MLRVWVQDVGFYAGNHTAKSYIALIESLLLNFFFWGGVLGFSGLCFPAHCLLQEMLTYRFGLPPALERDNNVP